MCMQYIMIDPNRRVKMQLDMFDETLTKKIHRLEKWIYRLNREMLFLKEVYKMRYPQEFKEPTTLQIDMFG